MGDLAAFENEVVDFGPILHPLYHGQQAFDLPRSGLKKTRASLGFGTATVRRADERACDCCALLAQARELHDKNDTSGFASGARLTIKKDSGKVRSRDGAEAGPAAPTNTTAKPVTNPRNAAANAATASASAPQAPRGKTVSIAQVLADSKFGQHQIKYPEVRIGASCMFHGEGGGKPHSTEDCLVYKGLTSDQTKRINAVCSAFPVK